MRQLLRPLLVAAFLLQVIACGRATAPVLPGAQPAAPPTAQPPTPRPAVQDGVMRIELYEWSISPEPFEVAPGTYRAEVVNMGRRAHDLIVAGEREAQTRRLGPGQSQTITFVLKPGEATIWCSVDDHREMGMEAYLQVG